MWGHLVTVGDVLVRATLEYSEGEDLDTYSEGIKVNPTPSCNHHLLSQEPLDHISL